MTTYADKPIRMTARDTRSVVGTKVPMFTSVHLLADRADGWSLCQYKDTLSVAMLPTKDLRMPYKEEFPVRETENPMESREFFERCQTYRMMPPGDQAKVVKAFERVQEFIQFHYQRVDRWI